MEKYNFLNCGRSALDQGGGIPPGVGGGGWFKRDGIGRGFWRGGRGGGVFYEGIRSGGF